MSVVNTESSIRTDEIKGVMHNMKQEDLQKLLRSMSLKEKVDQMLQLNGSFYQEDVNTVLTGPAAHLGLEKEDVRQAGSILGTPGAEALKKIQKEYMEKQPHHIPLLFMLDVIHGMRTIFPMPLAQGASFDPEMSGKCAAAAAKEAAVSGIHVTFAPMVDLVRDARWGRVMESTGEDPYLNSRMAEAMVRGFQGDDMRAPGKVCACIKHFAGYGAPTAGRDYNTVELSAHTFREFYLKAYQAGIDAGAGLVMSPFNTVDGIPASVNRHLMRDVLRGDLAFDGVLISDYASIEETIAHGVSQDRAEAAQKAVEAGMDIDMMTGCYCRNLCSLVEKGIVPEALIDEAVMRILTLKNRLGLFENPYKDADPEAEKNTILCREHRELSRKAAAETFVLLKNDGILPLSHAEKTAFIGPYVDNPEIISSWAFMGRTDDCVTIRKAAMEVCAADRTFYEQGSRVLDADTQLVGFDTGAQAGGGSGKELTQQEEEQLLTDAVKAAQSADKVILALGESRLQSGEATSRGMLDLPECQMRLFREVVKANPHVAVVLFSGRPLDLREISAHAEALLEVWFPGTEGGHAVMDVLTGKVNSSGRLPISFPYSVGQCPVYYNEYATGRPYHAGDQDRFLSKYIDIPNKPLYSFGYGLSYTEFTYGSAAVSSSTLQQGAGETLTVSSLLKNTGSRQGTETVQLYIQDVTASVARPVRELKGFERVRLGAGEQQTVSFTVTEEMLAFLRADGTYGAEKGLFHAWIGGSSETENVTEFRLV